MEQLNHTQDTLLMIAGLLFAIVVIGRLIREILSENRKEMDLQIDRLYDMMPKEKKKRK